MVGILITTVNSQTGVEGLRAVGGKEGIRDYVSDPMFIYKGESKTVSMERTQGLIKSRGSITEGSLPSSDVEKPEYGTKPASPACLSSAQKWGADQRTGRGELAGFEAMGNSGEPRRENGSADPEDADQSWGRCAGPSLKKSSSSRYCTPIAVGSS